jgi:two-component system, chemotaxis family, chemotaxis protein CheY
MVRILVVEDSSATRRYIRAALEDAGGIVPSGAGEVEVVEAASGFEALRLLPRSRYDLVITDINMPDINGLELIRYVRESAHHRDVPVMIISTQSSERDRARARALGANTFLGKPFTPEALVAVVRDFLAGSTPVEPPPGSLAGSGGQR